MSSSGFWCRLRTYQRSHQVQGWPTTDSILAVHRYLHQVRWKMAATGLAWFYRSDRGLSTRPSCQLRRAFERGKNAEAQLRKFVGRPCTGEQMAEADNCSYFAASIANYLNPLATYPLAQNGEANGPPGFCLIAYVANRISGISRDILQFHSTGRLPQCPSKGEACNKNAKRVRLVARQDDPGQEGVGQ